MLMGSINEGEASKTTLWEFEADEGEAVQTETGRRYREHFKPHYLATASRSRWCSWTCARGHRRSGPISTVGCLPVDERGLGHSVERECPDHTPSKWFPGRVLSWLGIYSDDRVSTEPLTRCEKWFM